MDRVERRLAEAFRVALDMRRDMLAQGTSRADCDAAVAKILKANWPSPPFEQWPYADRLPRCIQCHGYGLVMRTVTNRLGCTVEEGTPCSCRQGDRYRERPKAESDFTVAGKAPKAKTFQRWGG